MTEAIIYSETGEKMGGGWAQRQSERVEYGKMRDEMGVWEEKKGRESSTVYCVVGVRWG